MILAALETYEKETIAKICSNVDISGAVLGDLFCNYRMFANGNEEMADFMLQLKAGGKQVYFQTPCYLTDTVFQEVVRKICYWNSQGMLDGILLQDVGLLRVLRKKVPNLDFIWSFMGGSRNRAVNLLHYQFLQSLAPVAIAEDRADHVKVMNAHGIPTVFMYGRISYATVNRLCYYTYENELYGEDCNRRCLKKEQHMVSEKFGLDLSVDGYLLGKKYVYGETAEAEVPLFLYAEDYETCVEKLEFLSIEARKEEK